MKKLVFASKLCKISIHALREESDSIPGFIHGIQQNFNPRSPRGERPLSDKAQANNTVISIHALREESDKVR